VCLVGLGMGGVVGCGFDWGVRGLVGGASPAVSEMIFHNFLG